MIRVPVFPPYARRVMVAWCPFVAPCSESTVNG